VQQKLNHLEGLLLDPEWVHNVTTFFQLRRLSMRCSGKIARFAEQLKQQREQKKHSRILVSWNEKRKQQAAKIQRRVGERRMHVQMLEDRLQSERHRLATMGGFSRFFRGRSVTRHLDDLAVELNLAQTQESEMLEKLDELQKRQPPDNQGLDLATKRSINFMILSFAQELFLHFADDDLAALSKEASEKSVGAVNYGGKDQCDFLLRKISELTATMERAAESVDVLQHRARLIAEHAVFRSEEDAVPVAGTVATIFSISANGVVRQRDGNLLGDNYWGLSKVLSR
jgi:hypothetical protein